MGSGSQILHKVIRRAYRISEDWRAFGPRILQVYLAKAQKQSEIEISLRNTGTIYLRPHDSDLYAFRQVFRDGEYDFAKYPRGKRILLFYQQCLDVGVTPVIIDAGANVGAASLWYSMSYPDAVIIAIEPDPNNAELCRKNLKKQLNVRVIEAAIAGNSGSIALKAMPESWATRTERSASGGIKALTVDDVMDSLAGNLCLLLVKIDIEGFESDLFAGDTSWVDHACSIVIEPHDWTVPGVGSSVSMQNSVFGRGFEMLISGENIALVAAVSNFKQWRVSNVH